MTGAAPILPRPALWVLAFALLAAGVLGVRHFLRPEALVAVAKRGTATRAVPGTVEVKAEFTNELKSELAGRVVESVLDVGRQVRRGDVLVRLDTGDLDLEIERIRNEVVAARRRAEVGSTLRAEALNLQETVRGLERQAAAGSFPQAEVDKQRRSLAQLEQRLELDEVNLRLALANLENQLRAAERARQKMAILAPADGVVTAVFARVGDLIGGNSPIATIIATTRTIEAKLSEENFAAVRVGQKASVRFLTFGADQYNGTVTKILPSADPTTQRYTVFLDVVLPEDRALLPGLTGEVSIVIAERPDATIVPRRALVGDSVYVLDGGRVVRRPVEKGFEGLNEVEILRGVAVDERVVVEQQDRLRDGDRVRAQVVPN